MNRYTRRDSSSMLNTETPNRFDQLLPLRVGTGNIHNEIPGDIDRNSESQSQLAEVTGIAGEDSEVVESERNEILTDLKAHLSEGNNSGSVVKKNGKVASEERSGESSHSDAQRMGRMKGLSSRKEEMLPSTSENVSINWLQDARPGISPKLNQSAYTFRMKGDWEKQVEALKRDHPELTDADLKFELGKVDELLSRIGQRLKMEEREVILLLKNNQLTHN